MEMWLGGLLLVVGAVACYAVLAVVRMRGEIKRLTREQYYLESHVKRVPDELKETVGRLRVQLAAVAAGRPVDQNLIRDGRLYHDVTAAEAQQLYEDTIRQAPDSAVLVDVRTPKEQAVRRIPGARLVPLEELDQRFGEEISSSTQKVFVFCASGERSRLACDFLGRQGYTNLYHVRDGLSGWPGATEGEGTLNLVQIQPRSSGQGRATAPGR